MSASEIERSAARPLRAAPVLALAVITLVLAGCTGTRGVAEQGLASADTTPAVEPVASFEPTLEDQIALVAGREGVVLQPIENASAWLGDADLAAYVDPSTHDEYIVDHARETLLSYEPGTAIYQTPLELADYEGEPSRDEILALAEQEAMSQAPDHDLATMRRTALRRLAGIDVQGDVLEYQVSYRRYSSGMRGFESVEVVVDLPSWSWTPSMSVWEYAQPYETPPPVPGLTMMDAIEALSAETGIVEYTVESAFLAVWHTGPGWFVELEQVPDEPGIDGCWGVSGLIDAVSGDVEVTHLPHY